MIDCCVHIEEPCSNCPLVNSFDYLCMFEAYSSLRNPLTQTQVSSNSFGQSRCRGHCYLTNHVANPHQVNDGLCVGFLSTIQHSLADRSQPHIYCAVYVPIPNVVLLIVSNKRAVADMFSPNL